MYSEALHLHKYCQTTTGHSKGKITRAIYLKFIYVCITFLLQMAVHGPIKAVKAFAV